MALAGGNENTSEDMGAFIALIKRIAGELGCLVLAVHHSGKDEARGSRGHSSLLGAIDVEIEIKREANEPGILKLSKQRDGEPGLEFGFDLKTVLMGIDSDVQEVKTCVVVETDAAEVRKARRQQRGPTGRNQRRVWDALTELEATATKSPGVMDIPEGALIVKEEDLYQAFAETTDDDKPEKRIRESFNRAMTTLKNSQPAWIRQKGGNVWRA